MMFAGHGGPAGQNRTQEWGYRLVARAHGFRVYLLEKGQAGHVMLSKQCPTLFWDEHANSSDVAEVKKYLMQNGALGASPQSSLQIFTGNGGYVFVLKSTGQGAAA
jgi:hypothetical protein